MKRARLLPALALSASLVLSACSTGPTAAEGAMVDGHTYSVADIQRATAELNSLQQPGAPQITPQVVITQLVVRSALMKAFDGTAAQVSEQKARTELTRAGLQDPGEATVDIQEAMLLTQVAQEPAVLNDPQVHEAMQKLQSDPQAALAAIPVEVNPRFGTWDPQQVQVLPEAPAWISGSTAQN